MAQNKGFVRIYADRIILLLAFLLPAVQALGAPINLVDDGGFEGDPGFSRTSSGAYSAWRYFSSGGIASGSSSLDAAVGTFAFKLTRNSTSGDAGIEKSPASLRPFIEPGVSYELAFRSKSPQLRQVLARVDQYDANGSIISAATINNTYDTSATTYQRNAFTFTAAPQANSCNISFRMQGGTGDLYLDDVSLTAVTSGPPRAPYIVLPTGVITTRRPRIEWRGDDSTAYELAVGTEPTVWSGIIWGSTVVTSTAKFRNVGYDLPTSVTLYTHLRIRNSFGWSEWTTAMAPFRIEPLEQQEGTLHLYDIFYTNWTAPEESWDQAEVAGALQGIVNRDAPRLYLFLTISDNGSVDDLWLDRLRAREGWLAKKSLQYLPDLPALVQQFRSHINGVVVWDPNVPATSNVAATIAGVENLLPVRYDVATTSAYSQLVTNGPRLPVVRNLVGKFTGTGNISETTRTSTGSPKNDAYIWAKMKYLDTGLCSPLHMGYYIDGYWLKHPAEGGHVPNHTLGNHDYFISEKGFFWDLSPWGDEAPVDDPAQLVGTDLATLKEILSSAYTRHGGNAFAHVGGFTPWTFKYTNWGVAGGTHPVVESEHETVRILSQYNAYLDADALGRSAMSNASLFRHMPVPRHYAQTLPPMPEELRRRGLLDQAERVAQKNYLMHYSGDYDSAAWVMNSLGWTWNSTARGIVQLAWPVNPNLVRRAAPFFEYAFRTRTAADNFIAGDSGAGYVNPTTIITRPDSGLPSALTAWQNHNKPFYQRFNYNMTGFLLNGLAGPLTAEAERMYLPFSGEGVVSQFTLAHSATTHLENTMPAFEMKEDLSGNLVADVDTIEGHAEVGKVNFLVFRSILKDPTFHASLNDKLMRERPHEAYIFTSPQEFAYLARRNLGGSNTSRATFLFNTVPPRLQMGTVRTAEFAVRNDGWDTWPAGGANPVSLAVEFSTDGVLRNPTLIPLPQDVSPGHGIVLKVDLQLPANTGNYQLLTEMTRGASQPFSASGDSPTIATPVVIQETPIPVTMSRFEVE